MKKDKAYYIIGSVVWLAFSLLDAAVARYGSPEGIYDEALALMNTDTGATLGFIFACGLFGCLSIQYLLLAIFTCKKADQQKADQLK